MQIRPSSHLHSLQICFAISWKNSIKAPIGRAFNAREGPRRLEHVHLQGSPTRLELDRKSFGLQPSAPILVGAKRVRLFMLQTPHNEPNPSQTSYFPGA